MQEDPYSVDSKPRGSTEKLPSQEQIPEGELFVELASAPTELPADGGAPDIVPRAASASLDIRPTSERQLSPNRYASRTYKVSQGPSNLTLAILWTIALASAGLAIYFFVTQ